MQYDKVFDPQPLLQDFRSDEEKRDPEAGDRRDGKVYRYTDDIVLAVNVAIVTGRPLLVRGPSGSGKSSLAYNVARVLNRRYYELVVTSRTQARDLLWRFDAVRRLGDAQAFRQTGPAALAQWESYYPYIEPGVLWWAFDPESAGRRGHPTGAPHIPRATDLAEFVPDGGVGAPDKERGPVILLDEIDKADPDFANNLLVPVGSSQFRIDEIGATIRLLKPVDRPLEEQDLPLIFITTNEERRLPQAFLRRCVTLELAGPGKTGLIEIAAANHGDESEALYGKVFDAMTELVRERTDEDAELHLNVAQYLDAVRACLRLKEEADPELLASIVEMTAWKERELA